MQSELQLDVFRGLEHHRQFRHRPPGSLRIGRQKDLELVLPSVSVGRLHAEISPSPSGYVVRDLGSLMGTRVNGQLVTEHGPLRSGDEITVSGWRLVVAFADRSWSGGSAAIGSAGPPADGAEPPPRIQLLWIREVAAMLRRLLDEHRRSWSVMDEQALRAECRSLLADRLAEVRSLAPGLAEAAIDELVDRSIAEVVGLGPLEGFLADPAVTEIMVNGPDRIFIEQAGRLTRSREVFVSEASLRAVMERMFAPLGRRLDDASPMADGRLPDGSRVNAVLSPPAVLAPCLTIRKFTQTPLTMASLLEQGTISAELAEWLEGAVKGRRNLVVSGGTGSGKTTLLRMLGASIPATERLVTVEDAAELNLVHPNLIALEAREANQEGEGRIAIRDLVRNALRMRPDRIIVGECRGGEALDMLQAMNTGHEGSLTTVHANHPRDVLSRLEVMVMMAGFEIPIQAIREQIASAVDVIIQQKRFSDGSRRITHVEEVCGMESGIIQTQPVFLWDESLGTHRRAL